MPNNQRNVAERLCWLTQARRRNKLGEPSPKALPNTPQSHLWPRAKGSRLYKTTVLVLPMKPVSYIPQSARLLDQLREVLRYKHYSLRTEEAYVYWAKFFVRWHGRNGQVRHPRDMGAAEVQQFLAMLTTQATCRCPPTIKR
ncbi:MAG: phage integrase N-terminal SAM-like domain-containing protein [Cyanobacteria bacterium CAN_BIN43]|nr:phage integrase N-terminal SAM-like domain-containing protein [Cyanobacteria bacterium CAN_BIN43]